LFISEEDVYRKEHEFLEALFSKDVFFKDSAIDYVHGVVDFAEALTQKGEDENAHCET
jgi:hypothetical protein